MTPGGFKSMPGYRSNKKGMRLFRGWRVDFLVISTQGFNEKKNIAGSRAGVIARSGGRDAFTE